MAFALASCGEGAAPTGQVAAVVDGQEVTVNQINAELANMGISEGQRSSAAANQALDNIVNRILLANAAREQDLGSTPEGALALKRAEDVALINLLHRSVEENAPRPSDQEADTFVNDNRAMFAERFITVVEQVIVPNAPQQIVAQMEPIDQISAIRALLDRSGIRYQTAMGSVDSMTVEPAVAPQLARLGVGDVYIIPEGAGVRVNAVISRQSFPITGVPARALAKEIIFQQRVSGQSQNTYARIVADKRGEVRYASGYAAPAPQGEGAAQAERPAA